MNNLFTFGDSFTHGNGCLPHDDYAKNYKKNDDDLIWPVILANKLNMRLFNYGEGLFSNDKIFDMIMLHYDKIGVGDIVIIQKSFSHRFDIPNLDDNALITLSPAPLHLLQLPFSKTEKKYTSAEIEHIKYMTVLFDGKQIKMRQDFRFNFFVRNFMDVKKVKKCVLWDIMDYTSRQKYDTILDATDGKINDLHWSYKGHKIFADIMYNKIYKFI